MATHNIITQKMTFWGKSFGKIDGKNVFVPFALPEEKLRVEIIKSTRDWDEARIAEILEPSPRRIAPPCPLYQKCGGCNLMHADYEFQLEMKKRVAEELFARASVPIPPVKILSKNPLGYRNRMEFLAGGLQERGTNNIIALEQCPVASAEINGWLASTPSELRPKCRAMVFGSDRAEPNLTIAEIPSEKNSKKSDSKEKILRGKKFRTPRSSTQDLSQNPVEVNLFGKKIAFDVKGFFQSNLGMLELAIPKIMQGLSGK
ncbi:MAG: class I SAM-dependent RNA methyltransferase, partial [Treponemataceae bacterium]|nr:class I SAM-dependent RNA methyltransferase [Treponemataceae bacterium]